MLFRSNFKIFDGKVKPYVTLQLYYEDLQHLSNQVKISVIREADVSHIYPLSLELGKNHTIFICKNGFQIEDSYLCLFENTQLLIKSY